ncbi:hypothetical protein E4U42_007459 [Claviceps africana]|uniref:Uncharacterized protein n=1 Tax=Claviceps africana TaxID=83212 RepID=A0A8K0J133_9HYPO|nr:hypothetical protein E4U42_007459 [Claviceps africana]
MPVDTLSLEGKVAIVTGSGRENGIGAGIALALARNGASVVVNHVSDSTAPRAERVAEMLREAGGRAIVVQSGVDTLDGARTIVKRTLEGFQTQHIDILVNNAGYATTSKPLGESSPADVEKIFQTNANGPLFMVDSVVPHMPPGGRIINISSVGARMGLPMLSTYNASKAALESLTVSWATELGRTKGITVNSVAPGLVLTDIVSDGLAEDLERLVVPMTKAADRVGTVADISDAVLLLVNEKSRWITGQTISVSGGVTH